MKHAALIIAVIAASVLFFSAIDFRVNEPAKDSMVKQQKGGVELCPVLSSPNVPQETANKCVRQAFGK